MPRYMLIIKGTAAQARHAAEQHKLNVAVTGGTEYDVTAHIETAATDLMDKLNSWLCEDGRAPFPAGSLLFWSVSHD